MKAGQRRSASDFIGEIGDVLRHELVDFCLISERPGHSGRQAAVARLGHEVELGSAVHLHADDRRQLVVEHFVDGGRGDVEVRLQHRAGGLVVAEHEPVPVEPLVGHDAVMGRIDARDHGRRVPVGDRRDRGHGVIDRSRAIEDETLEERKLARRRHLLEHVLPQPVDVEDHHRGRRNLEPGIDPVDDERFDEGTRERPEDAARGREEHDRERKSCGDARKPGGIGEHHGRGAFSASSVRGVKTESSRGAAAIPGASAEVFQSAGRRR